MQCNAELSEHREKCGDGLIASAGRCSYPFFPIQTVIRRGGLSRDEGQSINRSVIDADRNRLGEYHTWHFW